MGHPGFSFPLVGRSPLALRAGFLAKDAREMGHPLALSEAGCCELDLGAGKAIRRGCDIERTVGARVGGCGHNTVGNRSEVGIAREPRGACGDVLPTITGCGERQAWLAHRERSGRGTDNRRAGAGHRNDKGLSAADRGEHVGSGCDGSRARILRCHEPTRADRCDVLTGIYVGPRNAPTYRRTTAIAAIIESAHGEHLHGIVDTAGEDRGGVGPTAIAVSVGFTKNPRQLMAKAKVARAAKAPIRRSFCFVDDIII